MKRLVRLASWPIIAAIFFFWWRALDRLGINWGATFARLEGREGWLALAAIASLGFLLLQALAWRTAVGRIAAPLELGDGLRVWALSHVARYLPGGGWHVVGRVYLGHEAGIRRGAGALGVAVDLTVQLLGAMLIFALTLPFWPGAETASRIWPAALVLPVIALLARPRLLLALANRLLTAAGRRPLTAAIAAGDLIPPAALHLAAHALNALALAAILRAFVGSWEHWPAVVGAGMAAWIAGVVNVFTPGGLGTREAALTLALGTTMGVDVTAAAALVWRAATIAAEALGMAFIGLLCYARRQRSPS